MSKVGISILIVLISVLWIQFNRLFSPFKSVLYHHYESCRRIPVEMYTSDISKYDKSLLILGNDEQASFILWLEGPESTPKQLLRLEYQARGLYIYKSSIYIISQATDKNQTRIEVYSLAEGLLAFKGGIDIPLEGVFDDLIIDTEKDLYISQVASFPVLSNIFQYKDSYVYHCEYSLDSTASCRPVPSTQAISVSGITKNKFGDYFIAYSSIDYNGITQYKKSDQGNLEFKRKLAVRDVGGKIEYDDGSQRVYGIGKPWMFSTPSGAIEVKNWDYNADLVYRRLVTQDSLLNGASCSARLGEYIAIGSLYDKALLVCPIYGS